VGVSYSKVVLALRIKTFLFLEKACCLLSSKEWLRGFPVVYVLGVQFHLHYFLHELVFVLGFSIQDAGVTEQDAMVKFSVVFHHCQRL
jgi:hypothetical protein